MTDVRVFFGHTMEAMFLHAIPLAGHPQLRERYAEVGLDTTAPMQPAYSYDMWRKCLRVQREVALSHASDDEAAYLQGAHCVDAYLHRTILGGPLKTLLRMLGVRQVIARSTRTLRTANNFTQMTFEESGPNAGSLWINDLMHDSPHFIIGVLSRGLQVLGSTLDADLVMREAGGARFTVKWDQRHTPAPFDPSSVS